MRWIDAGELESLTLSGPHRRWIAEIRAPHHPRLCSIHSGNERRIPKPIVN